MRERAPACATDREVSVVAALLVAGVGEGSRPPPRPVAFDREAPPGERSIEGGRDDDRALVWVLAPRLPEPEGEVQAQTDRSVP